MVLIIFSHNHCKANQASQPSRSIIIALYRLRLIVNRFLQCLYSTRCSGDRKSCKEGTDDNQQVDLLLWHDCLPSRFANFNRSFPASQCLPAIVHQPQSSLPHTPLPPAWWRDLFSHEMLSFNPTCLCFCFCSLPGPAWCSDTFQRIYALVWKINASNNQILDAEHLPLIRHQTLSIPFMKCLCFHSYALHPSLHCLHSGSKALCLAFCNRLLIGCFDLHLVCTPHCG